MNESTTDLGRLTDALVALDRGYDDDSGFDIEEALQTCGLTLVPIKE